MAHASTALAAIACLATLTAATAPPAPTDSSHVVKTPAAPAADTKPKPAAAKQPAAAGKPMTAWRKAYIARTGHEPGASAKAAPVKVAAKPHAKHAAMPLMKQKRCT